MTAAGIRRNCNVSQIFLSPAMNFVTRHIKSHRNFSVWFFRVWSQTCRFLDISAKFPHGHAPVILLHSICNPWPLTGNGYMMGRQPYRCLAGSFSASSLLMRSLCSSFIFCMLLCFSRSSSIWKCLSVPYSSSGSHHSMPALPCPSPCPL